MNITGAATLLGHNVLAKRLGISPQNLSTWKRRGVPLVHCASIERATGLLFRRWDERPHDWHLIWPELTVDPEAPDVPGHEEQPRQGANDIAQEAA